MATLALLALAPIGSAQAGALYTNEFSTPVQGSARAGAAAWVFDASIALHNPAGMTKLDDHAAATGFSVGWANIEFDADEATFGGGNGGDQGGVAVIPSANYVHRISDRFRFGLTAFSLSGSLLDPSNNWAGRFEVTELQLLTLSLGPSLGIRLTDWLSIGGGPVISYGRLEWELKGGFTGPGGNLREGEIDLDELDDWEATGRVGIMLHPIEELNIGVTYLGETEFDLDGSIDIDGELIDVRGSLDLELPFPQQVEVGVSWRATEQLTLLGTFTWEDWSEFDDLPISVEGRSSRVPAGFKDTYKVAAGLAYELTDQIVLQTGVAYDTSPLQNKDRITALPLDEQIRGAVGGIYRFASGYDVGLNFVYVNFGEGKVRTRNLRGDYDRNQLFLFGFTLGANKLPWSGRATL